jgi:hypothetical protein
MEKISLGDVEKNVNQVLDGKMLMTMIKNRPGDFNHKFIAARKLLDRLELTREFFNDFWEEVFHYRLNYDRERRFYNDELEVWVVGRWWKIWSCKEFW